MQTEPPKADPPKRKRRGFQFSLRTLLVVMLLAGLGARWMALKASRQKAAVEAVVKDGGSVSYDFQFDASVGRWDNNAEPSAPAWLRKQLGNDMFTNVIAADVLTNAGLEQIDGLPKLRILRTSDNPIGAIFGWPRITDRGLEHLAGLTQLRTLGLSRTKVTDAGLEYLKDLTGLQWLELADTRVTDNGLKHIQRLTRLEHLDLTLTGVTGAGLARLKGLTQLRNLQLAGTAVSDVGLEHLKGLSQLRTLHLASTRVTDPGVAKLQISLPNCKIWH